MSFLISIHNDDFDFSNDILCSYSFIFLSTLLSMSFSLMTMTVPMHDCNASSISTALNLSMSDNQNILKNGTSRICLNIFGLSD